MANVQINRPTRATETREKEVRMDSWKPAHDLPVPAPQDGYEFGWKRSALMGVADPANMARVRREGWVPCKAEDHPEIADDFAAFGLAGTGLIEIGGLVLCKVASELAAQRRKYYDNLSNAQMESVDNNFMKQNDPRMPLFAEKKSTTSFGKGF